MTDPKPQTEKPKASRGITARLPEHTLAEMREANQDLNMPLEVLREIVDAHVAGALPPGKVTELVVARRRKDDEELLAKRHQAVKAGFVSFRTGQPADNDEPEDYDPAQPTGGSL